MRLCAPVRNRLVCRTCSSGRSSTTYPQLVRRPSTDRCTVPCTSCAQPIHNLQTGYPQASAQLLHALPTCLCARNPPLIHAPSTPHQPPANNLSTGLHTAAPAQHAPNRDTRTPSAPRFRGSTEGHVGREGGRSRAGQKTGWLGSPSGMGVWIPHSVLFQPLQRPERGSSPGATLLVHGWQPIDGYPIATSGFTGRSCVVK